MDLGIDSSRLEALSGRLRELHQRVVAVEQAFHSPSSSIALLDRLANDPAWGWLRPLSQLIAAVDHVLAEHRPTQADSAVMAALVRGLLSGEGELENMEFQSRYRALLQLDAVLASMHGELKALLREFPPEPETESERLHAREQWGDALQAPCAPLSAAMRRVIRD